MTEHLKPWHKFCDDNYLLDWKSVYDVKTELKQLRTCEEGRNLPLPSWVKLLNDPIQKKVQERAKNSLAEALQEYRYLKGKRKCDPVSDWHCGQCPTSQETYTSEAFFDHLRDLHDFSESHLTQIKQCLDESDEEERREKWLDELVDAEIGDIAGNHKRDFVGEEDLKGGASSSSSRCIPDRSKRVKVA